MARELGATMQRLGLLPSYPSMSQVQLTTLLGRCVPREEMSVKCTVPSSASSTMRCWREMDYNACR